MMVHPWPEDRLEATCLAVDHIAVHYHGRDAMPRPLLSAASTPATPSWWPRWPSACSASSWPPATRSTASSRRAATPPTSSPRTPPGAGWSGPGPRDLAALRPASSAASRPGRSPPGSLEMADLSPTYSHFVGDADLTARWRRNAEELGRSYTADEDGSPVHHLHRHGQRLSALPSIHPMIGIDTHGAVNTNPSSPPPASVPRPRPPWSTGRGHGLDGHRRAPPIPPCASACWRHVAEGDRGAGRSPTGLVHPEDVAQHIGHLAQRRHPA